MRLVVRSQYDVNLSEYIKNNILLLCFSSLKLAQLKHERCEEMDQMAQRNFLEVSIPLTPAPNLTELELLRKLSMAKSIEFRRIKGSLNTFPTVQMFISTEASGRAAWGKCFGDVDEDVEPVGDRAVADLS